MFECSKLFSLFRETCEEIRVDGEICVHDGKKVIFQSCELLGAYPMRSLLKPFQFYTAGLSFETDLSKKWAPCLGSISATQEQVKQLREWYLDSNSKLLISKLKLTPQLPADEENRVKAKQQGVAYDPMFHMCFSKHLAILMACQKEGWNLETYHETNHPFHERLNKALGEFLEDSGAQFKTVTDGCKLPSPTLTVAQMAKLYQVLASASEGTPLGNIRRLMTSYPDWVGGAGRVDTLLMQQNPGLVAKEGADGLLGISVPPSKTYPHGLGIVVKIFSGFQMKLAALAVSPILRSLHLNPVDDYSPDHRLVYHYQPFQKKTYKLWDISPLLSEAIAVWPGDQKFARKVVLDTLKDNHLTLSSISTTLHVGAHTDAVNHTEKVKKGIDEQPIEIYCGYCQVIEVTACQGGLIERKDLEIKNIRSRRILVKTGSFPEPNQFNEDFFSFSEEAVDYLAGQGVILVGIDTPSIDPFSSKDLPAHHAVFRHGMAILEGIVLQDVPEGFYQLSAVPLRIAGGDASPVRAFLTAF